jgi:hypothetical protein
MKPARIGLAIVFLVILLEYFWINQKASDCEKLIGTINQYKSHSGYYPTNLSDAGIKTQENDCNYHAMEEGFIFVISGKMTLILQHYEYNSTTDKWRWD